MRTLILLLVGTAIALAGPDDLPAGSELSRHAASDAKVLGELLRENWTVQASGNVVTLTSKFEVFHVGMMSRPSRPPEFSDSTSRMALLQEAQPKKYVIRLRYEQSISREELEIKRIARQKSADILNYGAQTKEEYQKAGEQFANIKVPRYRPTFYDIYEELPETPSGRFYPPKSVQMIGGAKEILSVLLGRVRTSND